MKPTGRMMVFYGPEPTAIEDADVVTVAFHFGGKIAIGAGTTTPRRLLERLRWLVEQFAAHPELLEEACGIRGAARGILPGYVGAEGDS